MTNPQAFDHLISSSGSEEDRAARRVSLLWGLVAPGSGSALLDVLSALLAGLIAFQMRFRADIRETPNIFGESTLATPSASLVFLLLFGVYIVLVSGKLGLYRRSTAASTRECMKATLQAVLGAGLLLCGTLYLARQYPISRVVVVTTVLIALVIIGSRRWLSLFLEERRHLNGVEMRNVLIVGEGRVAHALRNHLGALRRRGFRFKGFISTRVTDSFEGVDTEVVGSLHDCIAVARALFVDEIYFSTPLDRATVLPIVEEARSLGIDVRVVPDLYDGLAWHAPVEYIGQFPTIPLHRREPDVGPMVLKRAVDILVASLALLLASPIMLITALMIRLDSKGPILYSAERVGRKGKFFECFKFRTMVPDADGRRAEIAHLNERDDILFKVRHDPRITRVGARLRKYSIDELPQLINVLKGDMSLVGPRPPLASEVDKYSLAHLRRLNVLPGITGLWQVQSRQDPSFDSYITLDTEYVENWTLLLDLRIMLLTASVIFGGTGS